MNFKSIVTKGAAIALMIAIGSAFAANNNTVTLRPTGPTHYFLTPMAKVNDPYDMVVGLHEFSFALPGSLQLQMSIIDNIGKTFFGAKYGLNDNMAIGGGIAGSLIDMGHHGPGSPSRLGLYFTYAFAETDNFGMAITPHTQIGSRLSFGADFGFMTGPVELWKFVGEAGMSVDTKDERLYMFGLGGIRINPPAAPFLFVDFGIKTNEFPVVDDTDIHPRVFIDIMVCFMTN